MSLDAKEGQLEGNIVGMNMRVLAISTMVAQKIIKITSAVVVNTVFAFIFMNALSLDTGATLVKHVRHSVAAVRILGRCDA